MIFDINMIMTYIGYYFVGMFAFVAFVGIMDGLIDENTDFTIKSLLLYPILTVYTTFKMLVGILVFFIRGRR